MLTVECSVEQIVVGKSRDEKAQATNELASIYRSKLSELLTEDSTQGKGGLPLMLGGESTVGPHVQATMHTAKAGVDEQLLNGNILLRTRHTHETAASAVNANTTMKQKLFQDFPSIVENHRLLPPHCHLWEQKHPSNTDISSVLAEEYKVQTDRECHPNAERHFC